MQNTGEFQRVHARRVVLIDTYRCLMQNSEETKTHIAAASLNRYISLLNAEHETTNIRNSKRVLIDTYRCLMQNKKITDYPCLVQS